VLGPGGDQGDIAEGEIVTPVVPVLTDMADVGRSRCVCTSRTQSPGKAAAIARGEERGE
jgi:hypothetical protein